jgi:hypothetical protein
MSHTRTVVLYGDSLTVAAIGAGLTDRPDWRLIPVDAAAPGAARRVHTLHPDAVLFDLTGCEPEVAVALLREQPAPLLIGIDLDSGQALVLSGQHPSLLTAGDLIRLIEA